jgi:hypothetical protein
MLFRGVIVYCDDKHIKSATGIVRILLLVRYLLTFFQQLCVLSFICDSVHKEMFHSRSTSC